MEHDAHTGFIVAAYVIAALVILGMITAILWDYATLKRGLKRLGAAKRE